MDVSKIDIKYIDTLDTCYIVLSEIFNINPIATSVRKQRKFRRWVEDTYLLGEDFPLDVKKYIDKNVSDADFLGFLKECHEHFLLYKEQRKLILDETFAELSTEVRSVLWEMLEDDIYYGNIRRVGEDLEIDIEDCDSYKCTLTLQNISYITDITNEFEYISFDNGSFVKEGNEYKLFGEIEDYASDTLKKFAVYFTDVKVKTEIYGVGRQFFGGTPWQYIHQIACEILNKYLESSEYLNEQEKELLPLIIEISKISYVMDIYNEFKITSFTQLKAIASKLEYNELIPF